MKLKRIRFILQPYIRWRKEIQARCFFPEIVSCRLWVDVFVVTISLAGCERLSQQGPISSAIACIDASRTLSFLNSQTLPSLTLLLGSLTICLLAVCPGLFHLSVWFHLEELVPDLPGPPIHKTFLSSESRIWPRKLSLEGVLTSRICLEFLANKHAAIPPARFLYGCWFCNVSAMRSLAKKQNGELVINRSVYCLPRQFFTIYPLPICRGISPAYWEIFGEHHEVLVTRIVPYFELLQPWISK